MPSIISGTILVVLSLMWHIQDLISSISANTRKILRTFADDLTGERYDP